MSQKDEGLTESGTRAKNHDLRNHSEGKNGNAKALRRMIWRVRTNQTNKKNTQKTKKKKTKKKNTKTPLPKKKKKKPTPPIRARLSSGPGNNVSRVWIISEGQPVRCECGERSGKQKRKRAKGNYQRGRPDALGRHKKTVKAHTQRGGGP